MDKDFDKILKRIEALMPGQYRKDAEFRMNIVMSQLGDVCRFIYHDPKLNPPARPVGTKKGEEDAFGHSLLNLLMAAQIRDVDIERGLETALKNLEDKDWVRRERKHSEDIVFGTVGHKGKVSGEAFLDPEGNQFENLDNHILVTEHIRPDIILYIKKIKGIITNHGGKFSHAAILAREYNIPCIVGTGNATEIIRHGQKIKLYADGEEEGLIHLTFE